MADLRASRVAPWAVGLVCLLAGAGQAPAERTSENTPQFKRVLERFPKADADGDGVLTEAELRAFAAKRKTRRARARAATPMAPAVADQYEKGEHACADGKKLTYYLMKPKPLDPTKRYALVVCLHGAGGRTDAAALLAKAPLRDRYPCYVAAPKAGAGAYWSLPKHLAAKHGRTGDVARVIELVESLCKRPDIDPARVYVTGQSMGGFGSFGAIVARPELFAAAAPICGGWDPADAAKVAAVPVWAFHGGADKVVAPSATRDMIAAMRKAGGAPKYTEYPDVGHNSWVKAYADPSFWKWLFAQRRDLSASSDADRPKRR